MKSVYLLTALLAVLSLEACATIPKSDYSKFFEHHPRSILIVPPFNKTTAVDAPGFFLSTISKPFAERGYYVFPVFLTRDILIDMGLPDEGVLSQVQPQRFRETFGADSVLFVTIKAWSTTYVLLSSAVTVEAAYKLVDTDSGEVIWEASQKVVQDSSGGGSGGGGLLGALIGAAIKAALHAVITDYRPLAQQANSMAVRNRRAGLPTGPYGSDYQKDYANYRD
jgi:hypothetical protein